METYSNPEPMPSLSSLLRLDTFYGLNIDQIPVELFSLSENLQSESWPDFSVKALADWQSSITPSPYPPPDDCCLVAVLPYILPAIDTRNDWRLVVHETGGIWQEPRRVLVRRLAVSERGRSIAHRIARHMAGTNISARFASFDQLNEYRSLLNDVGLDCNEHVRSLAEAFYPIDLAEEVISIFGVIDFPSEIFEGIDRGGMFLAIMAPNCSEF